MPIPGRDIDHDPAPFDGLLLQGSDARPQQSNNPTHQVHRMRRRQQVNERTVRIRTHQKSPGLQFAPRHPLPHQKSQSKDHGRTQPRKTSLVSQRNSGNRPHRSQRRPSRNVTPRSFHGQAAHQKYRRVDEQQRPRQLHSAPVAKVSARQIVKRRQAPPHNERAGQRNKHHADSNDRTDQSQPRPPKPSPIIRQPRIRKAPPIISPAVRRRGHTSTATQLIYRRARCISRHKDSTSDNPRYFASGSYQGMPSGIPTIAQFSTAPSGAALLTQCPDPAFGSVCIT